MFSGIIHSIAKVCDVADKHTSSSRFSVYVDKQQVLGLKRGASCALNGVCLSVVDIEHPNDESKQDVAKIYFELGSQTQHITTLKQLTGYQKLHFERSICFGDEQGGHMVYGHVEGISTVIGIEDGDYSDKILTLQVPDSSRHYLFVRAYIALNGVSLTISHCNKNTGEFSVNLIPITLKKTLFSHLNIGDKVNFEVDYHTKVIVDVIRENRIS